MKVTSIVLVCAMIFAGCTSWQASTKPQMDSWLKHHKSELIQSWGPPTATADDGNGGQILIFDFSRSGGQIPGTIQDGIFGGVTYTTPQRIQVNEIYMFYVDSDGVIYHWRAESNKDQINTGFGIYFAVLLVALVYAIYMLNSVGE